MSKIPSYIFDWYTLSVHLRYYRPTDIISSFTSIPARVHCAQIQLSTSRIFVAFILWLFGGLRFVSYKMSRLKIRLHFCLLSFSNFACYFCFYASIRICNITFYPSCNNNSHPLVSGQAISHSQEMYCVTVIGICCNQ